MLDTGNGGRYPQPPRAEALIGPMLKRVTTQHAQWGDVHAHAVSSLRPVSFIWPALLRLPSTALTSSQLVNVN